MKPGQVKRQAAWVDEIGKRKQQNIERMAARLNADPSPMMFSSALRAVRNALATQPDVYVVNEGANTLDFGRNIIDMDKPRHRLDSGTWGVMGIGMGYAIGAAAVTGKPVVAIEGDSAFGFSGMEIETICRYELPVTTVVFNNNGVYRGDPKDRPYSPTGLLRDARYEKIIEAFGGAGYHATDTPSLTNALSEALASRKPALINAVIDPTAGTESGHIQSLNPRSAVAQRPPPYTLPPLAGEGMGGGSRGYEPVDLAVAEPPLPAFFDQSPGRPRPSRSLAPPGCSGRPSSWSALSRSRRRARSRYWSPDGPPGTADLPARFRRLRASSAIAARPVARPKAVSQVPFSVNNAAISAKRPSSSLKQYSAKTSRIASFSSSALGIHPLPCGSVADGYYRRCLHAPTSSASARRRSMRVRHANSVGDTNTYSRCSASPSDWAQPRSRSVRRASSSRSASAPALM